MQLPSKPSQCVAALSLSEDGAEHPYLTIFYTVSGDGTIYFFGLIVVGVEEIEEERRLLFKRHDGPTNDPDRTDALIQGRLLPNGTMKLDEYHERYMVVIHGEDEAKTFSAAIRALYQMQGELAG